MKILIDRGIKIIDGKIYKSQVRAAVQIIVANGLPLPDGLHGFEKMDGSDSYYKELERYSKYCDLEHLNEYECEALQEEDYAKGKKKHQSKLDNVNQVLEKAGYKPNAEFDLGEKGHFSLNFDLVPVKKVEKRSFFGVNPEDLQREIGFAISTRYDDYKFYVNTEEGGRDTFYGLKYVRKIETSAGEMTLTINLPAMVIHVLFVKGGNKKQGGVSTKAKTLDNLAKDLAKLANKVYSQKETGFEPPTF